MKFPVFLLSDGRKAGKCRFTADDNSGNFEISRFPPLRAEETWKCSFTADECSGKAAVSRFAPLGAEETWKCGLPPMRAAVKLQLPAFLLSELGKPGKC
ncbi:hypothetical protein MRB53_015587 [Persea americana]|uniref:Uncharacterized protein n=1 Tax=Persea americana TaxID=3435 RepID=A0ACC2M0A2_PERAE|nr:hypothetical protein MRB53_015587 [Persea americana]